MELDQLYWYFKLGKPKYKVSIYDILLKNRWQISDNEETLMKELFWSAREDYLRYTYKTGKRYVETT
jgi:hypothetical protein